MNEWHFLWSSLCLTQRQLSGDFLKYSFLMSFIVSLSSFPPFILLWLSFLLYFELRIMTVADPDHSPLLLLFLYFQDTIVFLLRLFLFFREHFLKGLCWCSFQLFFWLSPLTWIGSVGLVSASCQDPHYPSQCVTSMGPVQAAPPYEFS